MSDTTRSRSSDPSVQLRTFRDDLHALLRDLGRATWSSASDPLMEPAVDVIDRGGDVEIRVDLMGFGPDELVVEVEGDMLRLRGSRLLETDEAVHGERVAQRRRRHFLRGIQLPHVLRPETVRARWESGLLTLEVQRRRDRPTAAGEPTRPRSR